MPELPEVETVKETLKKTIVGKQIREVLVRYPKIVAYPSVLEFQKNLQNETVENMRRRGKWLIFDFQHYILFSHLRMEGRYYIKNANMPYEKHEHVIFSFEDCDLRYVDTRKFGRMYLYEKGQEVGQKPLNELGLEPFDKQLTPSYLKTCYQMKKLPIKTVLLDQTIVVGIGNIYADEILFLSQMNPYKRACDVTLEECQKIISATQKVLHQAILEGGTTIRSYESSEGIHGRFQAMLQVHGQEECPICLIPLCREKIGGRTTYFCRNCQNDD